MSLNYEEETMAEAETPGGVVTEGFDVDLSALLGVYRGELIETIDACAQWKAAALTERAKAKAKAKPGRKPRTGGDDAG